MVSYGNLLLREVWQTDWKVSKPSENSFLTSKTLKNLFQFSNR
jgi:hypothetical protein